ncbi:MAG TPA: hypothetical protein VFQ68_00105 [Streptosporangiaceae bacterium]|nr:hypothetical protein [Streptosporangiaceae bacterium]
MIGTAAAAIITAAVLVLSAACGGSPSPVGAVVSSRTANSQAVAFSRCMRSHGVPDFPDPASRGGVPKVTPQQVGVSDSRFRTAQTACASLRQPAPAQEPRIMTGLLNFARCMRAHGIPDWPDPRTDRNGQPVFDISGIDPASPRVSSTAGACTHLLVQSATGPTTIQLCGGIGEGGGCAGYGDPRGD